MNHSFRRTFIGISAHRLPIAIGIGTSSLRRTLICTSAYLLICTSLPAQKPSLPPKAPEPKATPAAERMAGLELRKKTEEQSLVKNIPFRNVGPTIMSGRVVDLEANPADPTEFYVAYASGGLWHTNNNGTTFTSVFDNTPTNDIGDIAVDWKKNANGLPTIWVGTGEANSSRSSYSGTGIYKSVDGGKTWQHKGLSESHHIGKVLLSPADPNTIWVAVIGHLYTPGKDRGVYKSTDGGETWKLSLFIDENAGAIDILADPSSPQTLYAISWHRERRAWDFVEGGKTSGIYKTVDGGGSWKQITTPESGFASGENVGRIGLDIFPGNSNILYAVVDNQGKQEEPHVEHAAPGPLKSSDFRAMTQEQFLQLDRSRLEKYLKDNDFPKKYSAGYVTEQVRSGKLLPVALADFVSDANSDLFSKPIIGAEVYRSDDGGATWKKMNAEPLDGLFYTYGYYFGKIWVSPFDVNEVYIAGVSLMKSKDGGKTFASIDGENQHGDHHAMWINPARKGHLINGNDGGVNISWDGGATWFKANTPAVGQFYSVNVDMAKPYNVYGGLQDNGVWTGPSTYSQSLSWYDSGRYPYRFILGGDGMQVQVDPRDNNTVYTGYQFGHYFRVDKTTGEATEVRPKMELGDKPMRFNWQAPIWLSTHNPDILYMGAQRVYRSLDKGDHFTAISGDLTRGGRTGDVPYGTLSTIHESPMRFGLIYAGSDDGLVHVTKDGGVTWTRISDKLPQHLRVNRVIASSHVEGRVYVVLSGFQWDHFKAYLYSSDDYGTTWTQLGTSLPPEPLNVVREDPVNPDLLFVGSDHGLYTTVDRGKTFMRMLNGLPPVAVHDLVIHPREHDLVVGTHGRSIYIANISELEQLTDSITQQDLYVYELSPVRLRSSWEKMGPEWTKLMKASLRLSWFTTETGPTTIRLKSPDGKSTFAVMQDSSEAGLNFLQTALYVDSAYATAYKAWLESIESQEQPKTYTKGRLLLLPGEYLLEVETANGTKRSVKLKLSAPPSSAEGTPGSPESPGEKKH